MKKISVLLVARNEEATISKMIDGILSSYSQMILEIVVVDDASTDSTDERIREAGKRYPGMVKIVNRKPPCGVGYAIKRGLREISPRSEYILSMDSDFLNAIADLPRFFDAANLGLPAVMGSRFCPGGKLIGYSRDKFYANRFFHFLARWMLGVDQADVTNNFKLYKRDLFMRLPLRSNHFGVNAETGILPAVFGIRVREIPVTWQARTKDMGRSKFSILEAVPDYFFSFCWCAWQLFAGRVRLISRNRSYGTI
jgi:dolichol-phosphate mannosyltransferase